MRSNGFLTSCLEDTASKLQRQQDMLAAQQVRLLRQCEAMERCRERLDRFIADHDKGAIVRSPSSILKIAHGATCSYSVSGH